MQLFMGIGIDLHEAAHRAAGVSGGDCGLGGVGDGSFGMLVAGQVLIGIGCAPAFGPVTCLSRGIFRRSVLRRFQG